MNQTVKSTLTDLKAGEQQSNETMAVLPLFDPTPRKLKYVTLGQALASKKFRIAEVSEGGSVPELDAINEGDEPVLLFDGEEVAGAKQNRVFNSSILVPAKSKIRIPVSCTERGRWNYTGRDFKPSGNVMEAKMRARKAAYVSASLQMDDSYFGDQSGVWRDVDALHASLGSSSPTSAMKRAFDARMPDLDELVKAFKPEEWQSGMVVSVNGQLMGLDYVSSSAAFAEIFPKLIRSYAVEGLLAGRSPERGRPDSKRSLLDRVRHLVEAPSSATESLHNSVGLGSDYRYTSRHLVGSALVADDEVAHMAFLPADESRMPMDDLFLHQSSP